jgi:hypothetical protein
MTYNLLSTSGSTFYAFSDHRSSRLPSKDLSMEIIEEEIHRGECK